MTKLLNGKAISTTLVSKDTYNAMTRIIRRGTAPATTINTENTKAQEENTGETSTTPQSPSSTTEAQEQTETTE